MASVSNSVITIALVGLPSSGKSSIINSLVGKRVAQSGIARTTLEAKLYEGLKTDDDITFNLYDLPGIADIEDKDNKFDNIVLETIKKCNIVIWVSDIIKAFITNHEKTEYEKIKSTISDFGIKHGIPIQYFIMLSKLDKHLDGLSDIVLDKPIPDTDEFVSCDENSNLATTVSVVETDEIQTEEDTTVLDIYKNIKEKFTGVDVIGFNAHGRSYYHKNSSGNLKQFVKQYHPSNCNISFYLKKYIDDIPKFNDIVKINYFLETCFKPFLDIQQNIDIALIKKEGIKTNAGMPKEVALWCQHTLKPSLDCPGCINCNNDKYYFMCSKCRAWLINSSNPISGDSRGSLNTTLIPSVNAHINFCNRCNIQFNWQWTGEKLLCACGKSIKKCLGKCVLYSHKYSDIASKFIDVYNSIYTPESKEKLIKFLLFDTSSSKPEDLLTIPIERYNVELWNTMCAYIKIVLSSYDFKAEMVNLNHNQIYRLIQIGKNLDIYQKMRLYTHVQTQSINLDITLLDNRIFRWVNVYNLEYFKSGKVFNLVDKLGTEDKQDKQDKQDKKEIENKKLGTEIYTKSFQENVKRIRERIYGRDAEQDIAFTMIPIAYERFGLFWKVSFNRF